VEASTDASDGIPTSSWWEMLEDPHRAGSRQGAVPSIEEASELYERAGMIHRLAGRAVAPGGARNRAPRRRA